MTSRRFVIHGIASARPAASREATGHYNRAIDMWDNARDADQTDALKRDVCSELALAIKKANGPFPRAHATLAMFLNELGDDPQAASHANIALKQNPNEFRAQLVKIDVALKGIRVAKVGVGDWITFDPHSFDRSVGETAGKTIGSLIAIASSKVTQMNFKGEVQKLVQIFRNVCRTNTDPDEFVMMAEALISMGDFIRGQKVPMPGGRPNLFAEVANSPIDKLVMGGREDKVADVRRRAEGRSLLFRA